MMEETRAVQRERSSKRGDVRNGRNRNHSIALLVDEIERLKGTIRELRACSEDLEAERQQLLRENRRLRREVTLSRLIEDLEASIESIDGMDNNEPEATPPAVDRLYEGLPDRFPFPSFFQIAEEMEIEASTARRCLLYFLSEDLLVQRGARLRKREGGTS